MVSTYRTPEGLTPGASVGPKPDRYKWVALTNTTSA